MFVLLFDKMFFQEGGEAVTFEGGGLTQLMSNKVRLSVMDWFKKMGFSLLNPESRAVNPYYLVIGHNRNILWQG